MTAASLSVRVADDYAYDIDETVDVDILFDLQNSGAEITLEYDRNGDGVGTKEIALPDRRTDRWYRHSLSLERARFAGRIISLHASQADISLRAKRGSDGTQQLTVCDIALRRSYTTSQRATPGILDLRLTDERGMPVSARAGVYDATVIGATHFRQYNWGSEARYGAAPYMLVPGQEDPRTFLLGHTIQLNIRKSVRNPQRYYQYHEVFEAVHEQGGVTGYAHLGATDANYPISYRSTRAGLALDVPYGLVDFIELVLPWGDLKTWFDFLNLGYRISLASGSDYPFLPVPGAMRTYVASGKQYSVEAWFDGLKAGRTFVTNGPMLEFTINGAGIGAELRVRKGSALTIEAHASVNPDIDRLEKLEIYQQGEVVARASSKEAEKLHLIHKIDAERGGWFVVKAQGLSKDGKTYDTAAVSAPIYVHVGESGFCKLAEIEAIVADLRKHMRNAVAQSFDEQVEAEQWDTWQPRQRYWPANKVLLERRMRDVNEKYQDLVRRASRGLCR
jgi:hypothetical protein